MNLNALKYILAIEQYGSMSEAAANLYVSQPYLSKTLKAVEDEYHFTIFKRTNTGLTPTLQGHYFLDMARSILAEVDQFDKQFHEETPMRALNISSFPSSYALAAYIAFMKELDSEVYIHCRYREENVEEVIDDVYSHSAGVGVIVMKERNYDMNKSFFKRRRMVCEKLFSTTPHLLVRTGHPLADGQPHRIEELYAYSLVAFEPAGNKMGTTMDDGFYNQESISSLIDYSRFRKAIYVRHRGTMHSILSQSDSVAIGNHITTAQLPEFGLEFVPLSDWKGMDNLEAYANTLYCIYPKDIPLSPYARRYIALLKKYGE